MLSKFDHIYKHGMLETAREINPMSFPVGFHGNRMIPVEYYYGHRFYRFEPQADPAYVPCKCMKPGGCTSWFYYDRLVYPRAAVPAWTPALVMSIEKSPTRLTHVLNWMTWISNDNIAVKDAKARVSRLLRKRTGATKICRMSSAEAAFVRRETARLKAINMRARKN